MTAVLGAVDTATTGFLSGAAGEMGRRSSEALADLVRRMGRRSTVAEGEEPTLAGADSLSQCVAPTTTDERRELADRLMEYARQEPDFARDLAAWLRGTSRLAPSAYDTAPGAARPQMLPPGTAVFTNRERVRDEVAAMADGAREFAVDAPRIVVFVGPGGIGKTAMAIHCARGLASRFPDGSLYVDLRGGSSSSALAPSDALVRFLHMLGVPPDKVPADQERQTDLYRDRTADRRLVVVLDNAHSVGQIRPLLTAAPGSLVIVTSRYRLPELTRDHGARVIRLDPLTVADSVRLLTRIVGPERVADQRAGATAVAQRCGGMPLALCETGARVAVREHLSWDTVERQFADRNRRSERNTSGMDDPSGTDAVLYATDLSYQDLSPAAARMYRLLGVWPWPSITVGAAAAAVDADDAEARALLEELAGIHLLEEVSEERYRFQDAVRRHAEERAQAEEGRPAVSDAVRRMVTWYLRFAACADFRVIPSRWRLGPAYRLLTVPHNRDLEDARAALAQLSDERENLAEAVRAADEYRFDELAWQLCEAMWGLHLRLGFHEQWVTAHLRGTQAARRCTASFGDPRAEGRMLTQLAFAHMGLGQLTEAERKLTEALAADQRAGHRRGQATAAEALGLVRLRQWRYADAEAGFREAQRILSGIGPGEDGEQDVPRGLAILEHHIGRALRGQGRLPESMSRLNSALALFQQLPERDGYNEARVRMSLGETQLAAGHAAAGGACLDEAFAAMEKEGAVLQQADAAEMRAHCARELGDPADEARRLRLARSLYQRSGDLSAAARVTARLAELGAQ